MKKMIFVLFLACAAVQLHAKENWFTAAYEYSYLWESVSLEDQESDRTLKSMGFNLAGYTFDEMSPIGLFLQASWLFPQELTIEADGISTKLNRYDVVYNQFYSGIAGIAFRTRTRMIQGYGGIGIHGSALLLGMGDAYYDEYISQKSYAVGLGLVLGGKINVTDNFFINLGASGAWDFYNYTDLKVNGYKEVQEYDTFRTFVVDPFVGLGVSWR